MWHACSMVKMDRLLLTQASLAAILPPLPIPFTVIATLELTHSHSRRMYCKPLFTASELYYIIYLGKLAKSPKHSVCL